MSEANKLGKKAARRLANQEKDRQGESIFEKKQFWYGLAFLILIGGIGLVQFGIMVSDSLGGIAGVGAISKLDIKDAAKLKEVFFSGRFVFHLLEY